MDYPHKPAPADFPIIEALSHRWSPRAIGSRPVEQEKISALFEAARWAPSASNGQPWRFLYATPEDGEERAKMESLLKEGNAWAKKAYLLIIGFADSKRTAADGSLTDNSHAFYDMGAATFALTLQLPSLGLVARQMAGFNIAEANAVMGVPERFVPATMIAVGYPENPSDVLHEEHLQREQAPRMRRPQQEFVFRAKWGA